MKTPLVEAIGTFFLVVTIPLAITYAGDLAPLAIGSILMVMIYAGGHISGGHYNPAVSLGVWLRGRISMTKMFQYWIAQIVGALLAGLVATVLLGEALTPGTLNASTLQVVLAELLFTFALVRVVLHTATDKDTEGNSFYGLAIGFTVLVGAYAVGSISGGAFNPAVLVGGSVSGIFAWSTIWMHLVGQLMGAVLAAYGYLTVRK